MRIAALVLTLGLLAAPAYAAEHCEKLRANADLWGQCKTDADCVRVTGSCGTTQALNAAQQNAFKAYDLCWSQTIDCERAPEVSLDFKPACVDRQCKLVDAQGNFAE